MTRSCPICRASPLPDRSLFCLTCGAELGEAVPRESYTPTHLAREVLPLRSTQAGERKEVSVLFADIEGSLAMAEALDPEEVHAVMDAFFELALECVHAHGGTINQFRGDGFMALFGAPRARGEDAKGALRAALAIRLRSSTYSQSVERKYGFPLLLRMGVHTGTVWVGSIGTEVRTDYTAEGRTVGLAARLERSADAGQILVSGDTARRVEDLFDLHDLGVRRFRGISDPVAVFEVLGPGPYQDRFAVEQARGLGRFVGRESELTWIESSYRAAQRGTLQRLDILGEAGIGKSRLLLEAIARCPDEPAVLQAHCRDADRQRAYSPWLEVLRRWPATLAGDDEAGRLAEEFGGDPTRVTGTREEFAQRVCALILGVAPASLIVALDDVHWLDPSSQHVLEELSRLEPEGAVLLLTTARREVESAPFASTIGQQIGLAPLTREETETLAASILSGVEDREALVALAVERGGGNPLFVEETARALLEGSPQIRRSARLEFELSRAEERIPETLSGVVAARIDALPDLAKELLQAGSTLGTPFDLELLTVLEPQSAPPEPAVAQLVARRLLVRDDRGELEFRHGLVRQIAYSGILLERRKRLHRACATALLARGLDATPDGASRIGSHFDAGDRPAEAITQLASAGRAYLKLHAPSEAAAHLRRCWQMQQEHSLGPPREVAAVALALASALNTLDQAGEAAQVLASLRPDTLEEADRKKLALAYIESGWVRFSDANDVSGARAQIDTGLALGRSLPEVLRIEMVARAYLARMLTMEGELAEAIENAERLVSLARGAGDEFLEVLGLSTIGSARCDAGQIESGLEACRAAAARAEAGSNEVATGFALVYLAQCWILLGDPARALDAATRALAAGENTDQVGTIHHSICWIGEAYLLQGEGKRAADEFERLSEINDRWPSTLLRRARGRIALRDYDRAAELAQDCLALKPTTFMRARALAALGLALGFSEPNDASADTPLRESISLCSELELRPHEAEARLCLAAIHAMRGETGEGASELERALKLYRCCGMERHAQLHLRNRGLIGHVSF